MLVTMESALGQTDMAVGQPSLAVHLRLSTDTSPEAARCQFCDKS